MYKRQKGSLLTLPYYLAVRENPAKQDSWHEMKSSPYEKDCRI